MAHTLKSCGMEYTFMDENRFLEAGVHKAKLFYPVLTEEQGKSLLVYPLCNRLQDMMFVKTVSEVLEELKKLRKDCHEDTVLSILLEGESLNSRSSGKDFFCDTAWLERFFKALEDNRDWIDFVLPGKLAKHPVPREKRYFPTSSFSTLMEWNKDGRKNSAPGENCNYRHFLSVYPESNLLYSRMMHTQVLTNQVRGDKYRKKSAREELWEGQNHSPYWHGPGRGIYNIQLRHNAYRFLIESEKTTREKGIFIPSLMSMDFDMDGVTSICIRGTP